MLSSAQLTISQVQDKVRPILRQYGVTRSSVFGSLVRGELKPTSDIDILIELDHPISLFSFAGLQHELEQALERKVDLGEYITLKPRIRDQVLAEHVLIL